MSLGICDRLCELLEHSCTELDLQQAMLSSPGDGEENTLERYVTALANRKHLNDLLALEDKQASTLEQLVTHFMVNIPNPKQNPRLLQLRQEASIKHQKALSTVKRNNNKNYLDCLIQ